MAVKHAYQSATADDPGSEISSGEWNADHTIEDGTITGAMLAASARAFPVGSVFLSVVDTNPATLLGYGTWSQIAGGRFLVGQTGGDAAYDTAEETGGAASHTHEYSQVPNHVHVIAAGQGSHTHTQTTSATDGASGRADASSGGTQYSNVANINAATLPEMTTDNPTGGVATGTTASGSNVPPYFTVYVWKRTA